MSSEQYLNIPRLVLAGLNSGCGKTTIASGIMAALRHRGLKVQGFKVGPDYIDPGYHTLATGLPSRNLDSWMVGRETLKELFQRSAARADVSIIEGVMGLFDGHGGSGESGSTAEVAKTLQAPVVLVLDISKLSRTAAAMVLGCLNFDPQLDIRGVIVNRAGSDRHWRWVKEAIEKETSLPVLGHLPRNQDLQLPERHLGLVPTAEHEDLHGFLDSLALRVESSFDVAALETIARRAPPLESVDRRVFPAAPAPARVRIGIARDEAFSFHYQDNLDLLEAHGAELAYFSPLRDAALPPGVRGIYLGGGFPEIYARQLSENGAMRKAIREAGFAGRAIYAECGGLMYLAEGVIDREGVRNPMVGLVPGWSSMHGMRLKLGYVEMTPCSRNPLVEDNVVLRGHEFHYSRLASPSATAAAWHIEKPDSGFEGFHIGNVIASYVHLHFAAHYSLAPNFVAWCAGCQV